MSGDDAYPLPGVSTISELPEWENFFSPAGSGVIAGVGSDLIGSLNAGARQAVLGSGAAMLRGFFKPVGSSTGTAIPNPDGQDRIDRLVLRMDRSATLAANFIKPAVVKGTAGVSTPPTIQSSLSSTGQWDLPISRWTSKSNGALSGLVDERYLISTVTMFTSGARPPATPVRLGIEKDTRRVLWADGSTWSVLGQDTGWADLTLAAGFTQGGVSLAGRVKNSAAYLKGIVEVGPILFPSGGQKIANIPAYLQPDKTIQIQVYQDGGVMLLAAAYAGGPRTGQLWLIGNLGSAGSNITLHIDTSWPV